MLNFNQFISATDIRHLVAELNDDLPGLSFHAHPETSSVIMTDSSGVMVGKIRVYANGHINLIAAAHKHAGQIIKTVSDYMGFSD